MTITKTIKTIITSRQPPTAPPKYWWTDPHCSCPFLTTTIIDNILGAINTDWKICHAGRLPTGDNVWVWAVEYMLWGMLLCVVVKGVAITSHCQNNHQAVTEPFVQS